MKSKLAAFIIFFALVPAAAFMLYKIFLPNYLADQIVQALHARGLSGVSLEVVHVSLSHAVLKNFRIGKHKGLFIREIHADYDRTALAQNRVHAIQLHGVEFTLVVANRKIDWGPLADYNSAGPMVLPFDSLAITAATLQLDWEGRDFIVPLTAKIKNRHNDSLALDLHARFENSAAHVQALCALDSLHGAFEVRLDNLDATILQHAQKIYFPDLALGHSGKLDANAHLLYQGLKWRAQAVLGGEDLQLEYSFSTPEYGVAIAQMQAELALKSDSVSSIKSNGLVNGVPAAVNATIDLKTRASTGEFSIAGVRAGELKRIVKAFSSDEPPEFSGGLSVRGDYDFDGKNIAAQFTLDGKEFSLRTAVGSHELQASLQKIEIDANLLLKKEAASPSARASKGPALHLRDFEARVHGLNILEEKLGLALNSVTASLPVNWHKQEMQNGKFSIARARWRALELAELVGDLQWQNPRLNFSASSKILENARLDLTGWLDHSPQEITAELSAHAPAFNLRNSAALVTFFPKLRDHKISGVFELEAHLRMQENNFIPEVRLEIRDANWQSKLTEARVDSIAGTLTINNLDPLTSDNEQHFTFASAGFGSFMATKGEALLSIAKLDSILVKSISCMWAGGKLSSRDLVLKPSTARIDFVLHAEALDLQAILDFVQYQGVKGQGQIYGELPITLHWGAKKRLSIGDGYLEARPQAGVLQLSKENAQALLGIRKDLDPRNASLEDQVSLMVINALQDMAYTNLRIDFKNEPGRGLMTYVRAQGYGPRHDQDQQIPIGGFNVNINHLDDLLNSMIWPQLGAEKIKRD